MMIPLAEIQAYAAICSCACVTIVAGSLASIKPTKAVLRARKKVHKTEDIETDEFEVLKMEDALLFPIVASVALMTLFLAFKYLSQDVLARLLGAYFLLMTTGALWRVLAKAGHALVKSKPSRFHLSLKQEKDALFELTFTKIGLAAGLAALAVALIQLSSRHYLVVNLAALALAFNAISLLLLDSFKTASATLAGLFFYDIFWVFQTSVMITVATKIDGPVKIQFPRSSEDGVSAMMLLGLGDIVIPGLFIAFCARFDYALALLHAPKSDPPLPRDVQKRPYLITSMIGYTSGLLATFAALHWTRRPQPALLFLSPSCTLSVVFLAVVRGELGLLWRYHEVDEERSEPEKKGETRLLLSESSSQAEIDAVVATQGPRTRQRTKSETRKPN